MSLSTFWKIFLSISRTRRTQLVDLTDGVEEINEDLAELENEFYESPCSCCGGDDEDEEYDDEDEDDTVFYSVECPGCGFKLTVDRGHARRGLL